MAFGDEDMINYLKDYDQYDKKNLLGAIEVNPDKLNNPKKLISVEFPRDGGNAYFYSKYVEEQSKSSGDGWRCTGGPDEILDVRGVLGFKEKFEFVENGSVTNWKMTKYFLYKERSNNSKNKKERSSGNKKVIYVVSK